MVPEIETVSAQTPPTRLDSHQRMRVRAAAFHATQRYPGVVGRVLAAELLAWEEFGYHLGAGHRPVVSVERVIGLILTVVLLLILVAVLVHVGLL